MSGVTFQSTIVYISLNLIFLTFYPSFFSAGREGTIPYPPKETVSLSLSYKKITGYAKLVNQSTITTGTFYFVQKMSKAELDLH